MGVGGVMGGCEVLGFVVTWLPFEVCYGGGWPVLWRALGAEVVHIHSFCS